jgi:hypothetical protein
MFAMTGALSRDIIEYMQTCIPYFGDVVGLSVANS